MYPAGADIGYKPALSNSRMDCMWGFVCEGDTPNFHFRTQDDLHRIAGWGQFAGVHRGSRMVMAFELFVSRYDSDADATGMPWAADAFLDLKRALRLHRYTADQRAVNLLPREETGGRLVTIQRLGKQNLVVMALWSGTLEIEGIAMYDGRPAAAKQTAWTSLARQIRFASNRGVPTR
jgi:hypothetical protein